MAKWKTEWCAAAAVVASGIVVTAWTAPAQAGNGDRLGALINQALREGGPFFTSEERTVIERKCGYAHGSWDGFDARMSGGVFHCTNGRQLDDPEVRAIMAAAGPRIARRVGAVMRRPEVAAAIDDVARDASAEALRPLRAVNWDWDRDGVR